MSIGHCAGCAPGDPIALEQEASCGCMCHEIEIARLRLTTDLMAWNIRLLRMNDLTAAVHSKCPCGCHPKSEPWYCQACNDLHEQIEKLAINASGRSADKEALKRG